MVSQERITKIRQLRESEVDIPEALYFSELPQTLRGYQKVGVASLLFTSRMVIGDDTGLGKTVMSLAAIALLFEKNLIDNVVVFTTGSSLLQWEEELYKFTQGMEATVLGSASHGTYKLQERIAALETPMPIVLSPYSFITPNAAHLLPEEEILDRNAPRYIQERALARVVDDRTLLIFDEATSVKNTSSGRSGVAYRVALKAGRVWGLTATIVKNSAADVYGVFKVVHPGVLGSKASFTRKFLVERPIRGQKWRKQVVGAKNTQTLKNLIEPFYISRRKQDVAKDLPEITSVDVPVEIYPYQRSLYEEVTLKQFERADGREQKKLTLLTAILYYQMLANSPAIVGYEDRSAKADKFMDMMENDFRDSKLVVFARSKRWINLIEKRLRKLGVDLVRVTGDESTVERHANIKRFTNEEQCRVCLITEAGSEAINLQAADTLVFLDLPVIPGTYYQTIGRIHRIGSKADKIWVYHFVAANTVDEGVLEKLKEKFEIACDIAGIKAGMLESQDYYDILAGTAGAKLNPPEEGESQEESDIITDWSMLEGIAEAYM